jgi:tripeptidyl-peptidase-1
MTTPILAIIYLFFSFIRFGNGVPLGDNSWGSYQVVEDIEFVPRGWRHVGPANGSEIMKLRLVVNGGRENELAQKLLEISTQGHADFGNHLNQEQVTALVAPDISIIRTINMWISSFPGVGELDYCHETSSISFQSTVMGASEMFRTSFATYQAADIEDGSIIRTLQYSLPQDLITYISLIHPITYFPNIKTPNPQPNLELRESAPTLDARATDPALLAACTSITPTCIAKMYNINYTPPSNTTSSGSSLGVVGFLEQWINHTDITSFVTKYGNSNSTRSDPGKFSVELVNGGINNESSAGIEATLDMEYSMPFTGSLPVVYYSVGGRPPTLDASGNLKPLDESYNEPYLEWLEYMLAKPDGALPQVSYYFSASLQKDNRKSGHINILHGHGNGRSKILRPTRLLSIWSSCRPRCFYYQRFGRWWSCRPRRLPMCQQ